MEHRALAEMFTLVVGRHASTLRTTGLNYVLCHHKIGLLGNKF